MGLKNLFFRAVLGPLAVLGLLFAHTTYTVVFTKAPAIRPPSGTVSNEIIKSRKPIIADLVRVLRGKIDGPEFGERLTDDVEFEDPFTRWIGRDDVIEFVDIAGRMVEDTDVVVHAEMHGTHEILLDMTMTIKTRFLPDITVPSRTHIMLDRTQGGEEKIFKIFEEWNGVPLLNEKTTISVIGKVQQSLKKFIGRMGAEGARRRWY